MYLAYMLIPTSEGKEVQLCLVADKLDEHSPPVPVKMLVESHCALFRIGPIESVSVRRDEADDAMMIEPYTPAKLFLTANDPQFPGMTAAIVKIKPRNTTFEISYQKLKDPSQPFKPWEPLKMLR